MKQLFLFIFLVSAHNLQAQTKIVNNEIIYEQVDTMPQFLGGDIALLNFVKKNTNYPKEALKLGISGIVKIYFNVDKYGNIVDVEVGESLNPVLDAEALRVIKSLPKYISPGILNGKPIKVSYTIPIKFTLAKTKNNN